MQKNIETSKFFALHAQNNKVKNVGQPGKTAVPPQNDTRKAAFTLAEVLITLGVIGVVAAITLPALITNVQTRIRAEQIRTAKYKFTLATDEMKSLGLIGPYNSTEAFVKELQKHLKLAKICPSNKLEGCWPTKEIKIDDEGNMYKIKDAVTGRVFKMPSDDNNDFSSDNIGIVTADGIPMILNYNTKCTPLDAEKSYAWFTDDNKPVTNATASCVAGIMDINGSKKPNKLNEDVVLFNANAFGVTCAMEFNGKCFGEMFAPAPISTSDCNLVKDSLGIQNCCTTSDCARGYDYWAGAVKQCGGVGNMPVMEDLAVIAGIVYKGHPTINAYDEKHGLVFDPIASLNAGLAGGYMIIWSGEEKDANSAYNRSYDPDWTRAYPGGKATQGSSLGSAAAFCIVR